MNRIELKVADRSRKDAFGTTYRKRWMLRGKSGKYAQLAWPVPFCTGSRW
jgi:hypothetical protein